MVSIPFNCGLKKVDELKDEIGSTEKNIKYEQWRRVSTDVKVRTGQIKKCTKVELVAQEGTMSEILEILKEHIMPTQFLYV